MFRSLELGGNYAVHHSVFIFLIVKQVKPPKSFAELTPNLLDCISRLSSTNVQSDFLYY